MATPSRGIDQWREYFRTANSDIFEIIERAIEVAAADCPDEFKLRKLRIAEVLFTARLSKCTSCNRAVPENERDGGGRCNFEVAAAGGSKESKANSSRNDQTDGNLNHHPVSNYSYGDAEALTDEIEEEDRVMEEVLRFRETLNNYGDESDSVIYDILRRLQLMRLNVDVLRETEIGKTVNKLRKHGSKQIRYLCYEIIAEWKALVDEWAETQKELELAEGTPDSVNPTIVNEGQVEEEEEEEVGLPSPPLDEGAFFTSQNIDFSKFFDGMDDDGNPRNNALESNNYKNHDSGRRPSSTVKQEIPKPRVSTSPQERVSISKDNKAQQMKPQQRQSVPKPTNDRPTNMASGPGRPVKPQGEQKPGSVVKAQQGPDKPAIPRRPMPPAEKARGSDDVQEKLEATKRKLQERYQEAQNAKRQRKIQVMELHDLPKQGQGNRNTNGKFVNRTWTNGRR